ncbi:MAG TPA: zinc-dependent metalloprotease, partial [Bryobacteraceae bacterium]|nr:zinc-dependent metalloprotease [Bryobacteraceae bacterium]
MRLYLLLFLLCPSLAAAEDYDKVVTKEAKTHKGLFTVHQIGDRFYYEIPKVELDKEFLWNTRIAKTTIGVGFGGILLSERVLRWHLNGNKVLLLDVNYELTADPRSTVASAVAAADNETIVMSFEVSTFGKDEAPVIDVTRLFTSDVPEFSIRQRIGATYMDTDRTWVNRISPYPDNLEAEVTQTWTRNDTPPPGPGQMRAGNATIVVHHSMIRLPEKPMTPRLFDNRVGYFTAGQTDFSDDRSATDVHYICRWRLEKNKPIVYYIDSATPLKWRDWIRQGVESWQPAFDAAGFPNAIVAKMAPNSKEDPDFSLEDIRHSVIRWLPSTVENAFGPNIHDPRTGEILHADIEFYQNMLNLTRNWYITQIGPLDPRVRRLPLPDDVVGEGIRYIVAHEVGHTLGLEHNLKASSLYPADKVHNKDWVHRMGYSPSIMDYVRFDYVAQPEDGIPVADLEPRIGPYDIWAIHWGYAAIAPAEEKATLDKWAHEQDSVPWYRYVTGRAYGSEPGELREAVGDADAVQSSALGMKNLRRVMKMLMPLIAASPGRDYDDLKSLYDATLGQWTQEMNHVAAIVGGIDAQTKHTGDPGTTFTPVGKDREKQAVAFLMENAFATPAWAIDPEIVRQYEPSGTLNRIRDAQAGVLANLLGTNRFTRLVETGSWPPLDFLTSVRKGIWRELDRPRVTIDPYRRNIQRAWMDIAIARTAAGTGDERPFYRAELKWLKSSVVAALLKTTDPETRAHLEATLEQIATTLAPKFPAQIALPTAAASPVAAAGLDCW